MHTLTFSIRFYSDWQAGNGLSSGADADALCIKDAEKFPFLPGKTLKGLLREQAELLQALGALTQQEVDSVFGVERNQENMQDVTSFQGCCFFSNAHLSAADKDAVGDHPSLLFRDHAMTAIDAKTGTAKDSSLRTMEIAMPLELEGEILVQPGQEALARKVLQACMPMVKQLGNSRSRGFGRCDISLQAQ